VVLGRLELEDEGGGGMGNKDDDDDGKSSSSLLAEAVDMGKDRVVVGSWGDDSGGDDGDVMMLAVGS
jgi:hypothetical protein